MWAIHTQQCPTSFKSHKKVLHMRALCKGGLVSSRVSITSWGEGAYLILVGHPSSDGVTIKISYGVDVLLHRPAWHPIFSYWDG